MPLEFVHSGIGESPSEAPFTGLARRSRVLGRSFYGRYTALVLFPSARLSGLSHLGFPFVALASVGPMQQDSAEGCVRLERGEDPAETVVVRNEAFLTALRQSAPAEVGRFVRGQTQTRWDLTLLAIVAVVALGSLLYFWGVPAAGRVMARMLPVAWEARLAEAVIKAWAPEEEQCLDEEKMASLRAVLGRLLEAVPASPYQYKLIVMRGPMNAFALPAGTIVVTDALLASTDSPEQLAGVLAHEIQHVEMGHSTQGLFREFAAQWLLSTLTGDASKGSMALETAALLADLSHSREDEAAAGPRGHESHDGGRR